MHRLRRRGSTSARHQAANTADQPDAAHDTDLAARRNVMGTRNITCDARGNLARRTDTLGRDEGRQSAPRGEGPRTVRRGPPRAHRACRRGRCSPPRRRRSTPSPRPPRPRTYAGTLGALDLATNELDYATQPREPPRGGPRHARAARRLRRGRPQGHRILQPDPPLGAALQGAPRSRRDRRGEAPRPGAPPLPHEDARRLPPQRRRARRRGQEAPRRHRRRALRAHAQVRAERRRRDGRVRAPRRRDGRRAPRRASPRARSRPRRRAPRRRARRATASRSRRRRTAR